jgi:hypothetical protein
MLRMPFDGCGKRKQFRLGRRRRRERNDVGNLRLAARQGAGLVEGQRPQAAKVLEMRPSLDQDTVASSLRDPRQDRRRCTQRQGARRRGHQQRHPTVERR